MIKKYSKFFIIFLLLFLTGCWDYKDINERTIALSIGVDVVNDNIEFSGEMAKLVSTSGDNQQKAQTQGVYNLLSYGKDFEEARIHYDAVSPSPVFLGATRVVVLGEKFAKQNIEPYLNRINKFYDYRKTLLVIVSREPPRELLSQKTEKTNSVGFLIEDILSNLKSRKMTVYSNVGEILSDIALGEIGYLLPYVGIKEGSIQYLGLAVMKDSKLVGIIDMEDTDGILYLLADKPILTESIFSSEEKNNKYSLRTSVKKRKIKTEYKNDKVIIKIDLDLAAELQYQYYIKPISDEQKKELENMASKKIEKDIINIFERSQDEFKCDIFHFAKYFRANHPRIYDQIKWKDVYTEADIEVSIKTKIINLGLIDSNAKKKY
ncbi:Ger(x)C family spore germination protein [Wukongibacter sp. M2B1]|uniref:Ger(x)C family spore germination protein n=1 Tax=Wukongibacter sp. M2B1 TaxID=3088895 RepID=UPI003D7A17DD